MIINKECIVHMITDAMCADLGVYALPCNEEHEGLVRTCFGMYYIRITKFANGNICITDIREEAPCSTLTQRHVDSVGQ